MDDFRIGNLTQSANLYLYTQRGTIDFDPPYQRLSDVWTLDKKQLLIDSILNGFDIPKFYLHELNPPRRASTGIVKYAIIDGKQRLSAIFGFIDNAFPLADDFDYLHDDSIDAAGLTYRELGEQFQELKIKFDTTTLAVVSVATSDIELIEEMFSRLNEAVPLNASEKRNAKRGPIPAAIRRLAQHAFFQKCLPFTNRRYRHYDTAAKFLQTEHNDGIVDTKKVYLDAFVDSFRGRPTSATKSMEQQARAILDAMSGVFLAGDPLLRRVGLLTVYYHYFRVARELGFSSKIRRSMFSAFEEARRENRETAEEDITLAEYDYLEFDRLNQTPNDRYSLLFRLRVLADYLSEKFGLPEVEVPD